MGNGDQERKLALVMGVEMEKVEKRKREFNNRRESGSDRKLKYRRRRSSRNGDLAGKVRGSARDGDPAFAHGNQFTVPLPIFLDSDPLPSFLPNFLTLPLFPYPFFYHILTYPTLIPPLIALIIAR